MILDATTQSLILTTGLAKSIHVLVSYSDHTTTTFTPGVQKTTISTATATTILASPGASTQRQVLGISITNVDTSYQTVLLKHDTSGGGTIVGPNTVTLQPNESLQYDGKNFSVLTAEGAVKTVDNVTAGMGGYASSFFKVGTAAEAAGQWYCYSKDTGNPGAWSVGTSGLTGRATDGTAAGDVGCLPYKNASSGFNYLKDYTATSTVAHCHFLFDVLWVNNATVVTTTTAQTINSVAFGARDLNGSANGAGVWVGILVVTATTNAGVITNTTMSYTNQAGTPGKTATISSFPATAVAGTVVWFQLAAGDTGVRSIQSVTLGTSYGAGAISLVAARPIAAAGVAAANLPSYGSVMARDVSGVTLYDGTCLLPFYVASATTATNTSGLVLIENR